MQVLGQYGGQRYGDGPTRYREVVLTRCHYVCYGVSLLTNFFTDLKNLRSSAARNHA